MGRQFTIEADGDESETRWWPKWTRDHFPSYQTFWAARIAPLTYRIEDRQEIHFQTSARLAASGFSDEDVAVAQLHYAVLQHLGRVFDLLDKVRAFTVPSYMVNRALWSRRAVRVLRPPQQCQ